MVLFTNILSACNPTILMKGMEFNYNKLDLWFWGGIRVGVHTGDKNVTKFMASWREVIVEAFTVVRCGALVAVSPRAEGSELFSGRLAFQMNSGSLLLFDSVLALGVGRMSQKGPLTSGPLSSAYVRGSLWEPSPWGLLAPDSDS